MTEITEAVIETLESSGFAFNRELGSAVSNFDSAAGSKVAMIWVTPCRGHVWINGSFWSEGRNILEPFHFAIHDSVSVDTVSALMSSYLGRVTSQIAGSYAVRLLARERECT